MQVVQANLSRFLFKAVAFKTLPPDEKILLFFKCARVK
jgi:hypothetical protein